MAIKRALIKEFLRIVEVSDLEDMKKKKIIITMEDGTEYELKLDIKRREPEKLRLVKQGSTS